MDAPVLDIQATIKNNDIQAASKAVQESAKKAKPDAVVFEKMEVGMFHWQGDVYFQKTSIDLKEKIFQTRQKTNENGYMWETLPGFDRNMPEHRRNSKNSRPIMETVEVGTIWKEIPTVDQLAPGNTRGSRHIIREDCIQHVKMFDKVRRLNGSVDELLGMVMELSAPVTIIHPEHGAVTLPTGQITVGYQRAHDPEKKLSEQGYGVGGPQSTERAIQQAFTRAAD